MKRQATTFAALGVLAAGATAHANYSDPVLEISVTTGTGNATMAVALADGVINPDGSFFWTLLSPVQISDGGNVLATLSGATTFLHDTNHLMSSSFVINADDEDIQVTITGNPMTFPSFNGEARASAGLTVTDVDGDGGTATGGLAGGKFFTADYNGGTNFAELVNGPISPANPFGSTTSSEDSSPVGTFTPVGAVTDMTIGWSFDLTADDSAGGTSVFVMVPTPGAVVLLSIGGLGILGRRRR